MAQQHGSLVGEAMALATRRPAVGQGAPPDGTEMLNEVVLVGRLSAPPVARTLPSGTEISSFRIVVPRGATPMTRGSRQKSDWMDCTAWSAAQRRRVASWRAQDLVEVRGALRRRHYRGEAGSGSRVEVEMLDGRRVRRAPSP